MIEGNLYENLPFDWKAHYIIGQLSFLFKHSLVSLGVQMFIRSGMAPDKALIRYKENWKNICEKGMCPYV